MLIISIALPANRYRNASIRLIWVQNFLLSIALGITTPSLCLYLAPPAFVEDLKLEQCMCQEGLTSDLFL
jgi:hypothetical protein